MKQTKKDAISVKNPDLKKEPIAIISMACRFPGGAATPELLWEKLCLGFDAIIDIPKDRWDNRKFFDPDREKKGKTVMHQGGFLEESIFDFDPLFFGMSPREAEILDPQQRLLLEVSWEAFEKVGYRKEQLSGSKTGVFIGGFTLDSKNNKFGPSSREKMSSFSATAGSMTLLANRLSYFYDLKGPSFSIDTACSGSLISIHQACMSLRNKESQMAIAGGVNFMLVPDYPIIMSKGQFLSPHCRCKTFDEDAQGYARGEGCGIVILKSYSQAIKDNDNILALILESGTNHDGRTSGIALPNPEAQQSLIEDVYDRAGIDRSDIQYVEAHGTGTQAGDAAEAGALDRVLSKGRQSTDKCLVGSIKSNFGHLEAAAGVAGLIKTVLCLQHGAVPPNLHFNNPNPRINFDENCLKVPTTLEPIDSLQKPVLAGVNSFGFGGANAHILLESVPLKKAEPRTLIPQEDTLHFIPLSAKSEASLQLISRSLSRFLKTEEAGKAAALEDLQLTLCKHKTHFGFRMGMVIRSKKELIQHLEAYAEESYFEGMIQNRAESDLKSGPVFVYTGMGPQWWGMGRELFAQEPLFRESVIECDTLFREISGWSILEALQADEESSRMSETQVAQPANFVIQIALTRLLAKWGIEPSVIVGHSVGEISAAFISGALSLKDALLVVYHRSRLHQTIAGQGTMLAVQLPVHEIEDLVNATEGVSMAAINSPGFLTLAGIEPSLKVIADQLEHQGVFNKFLRVEVAYHSYQMDPLEQEFKQSLASLSPCAPDKTLYSTVTGKQAGDMLLDGEYWWKNMRQSVMFSDAITAMINNGQSRFLEIGPHPVLASAIKECLSQSGQKGAVFSTLHREKPEQKKITATIGELYCDGFSIDWKGCLHPDAQFIQLPTYRWQKERHWLETDRSIEERIGLRDNHPYLNVNSRLAYPAWEVELTNAFFPYLPDHKIQGKMIFPGAAYVEAGLALQQQLNSRQACFLADLRFHRFLQLSDFQPQKLHVSFNPGLNRFSVHSSFMLDDKDWKHHASGEILDMELEKPLPLDLHKLRETICEEVPVTGLYDQLDQRGLTYGPSFQGIKQLWRSETEILLEFEGNLDQCNPDPYLLHPTVLDSCFQGVAPLVTGMDNPFVPIGIKHLRFFKSPGNACFCHLKLIERLEKTFSANLILFDNEGSVLVDIERATFELLPVTVKETNVEDLLYQVEWAETPLADLSPQGEIENKGWLFLAGDDPYSDKLSDYFQSNGIEVVQLTEGPEFQNRQPDRFVIDSHADDPFEPFFSAIKGKTAKHILYAWELEDQPFRPDGDTFSSFSGRCHKLISFIQSIMKHRPYQKMSLNLLISDPNPELSALSSLMLLIENEYPYLSCKTIGLDSQKDDQSVKSVLSELFNTPDEKQVIFSSGSRYTKQLTRQLPIEETLKVKTERRSTETPLTLEIEKPGLFESLIFREIERNNPGPGEVEVKILAAGLNFKDLLKVLGHLSSKVTEKTYFGNVFGMESAGIVERVGEGVTEFKPGDPVYTINKHICTYTTIPVEAVFHKPESLSIADTPILVPFLTAYYSLVTCSHLNSGEKVLIHSATGATGLSAVIIALSLGAEVFATAGSEEKREYLKSMGIKHVMNSRSLNFYEEVLKATDGKGVDVVLNALPGEIQRKSFELLASFGRFVEIGKQDIVENNSLPMQTFVRNTSFMAVDVDRMIVERPLYLKNLIQTVIDKISNGQFSPLPVHHFPAEKVVDAFRFFAQSRQIGKIILDFRDGEVDAIPTDSGEPLYQSDATCLITGGTRGFGLEIAKWLSAKGVSQLVLVSKSGSVSEESQQMISEMEQSGTTVITLALDVCNAGAVKKLLEQIRASMPPLKGIFHGAMVLDDAFIPDLNKERMDRVLEPKVAGVINLHLHSLDDPLQHFVMLSSISSLIGNPGQGNYIAANAFLDAFAEYRQQSNLPALSINWGALAETGLIARDERLKQSLEEAGVTGLTNRDVWRAFDAVIHSSEPRLGVFDIDWGHWKLINPKGAKAAFFSQVTHAEDSTPELPKKTETLNKIKDLDKSEQLEISIGLIKEELSGLINLPVSRINSRQKINDLGIDSLMAVEIISIFQSKLGVEFATFDLLDGPSIEQLAELLLQKLLEDQ